MKREIEQPIDNLFQTFLKESGIETPFYEHRLISGWKKIVGDTIAKATHNIYMKNQTLHVELNSPILRNELMMKRSDLVNTLNNYVGKEIVKTIVFY